MCNCDPELAQVPWRDASFCNRCPAANLSLCEQGLENPRGIKGGIAGGTSERHKHLRNLAEAVEIIQGSCDVVNLVIDARVENSITSANYSFVVILRVPSK